LCGGVRIAGLGLKVGFLGENPSFYFQSDMSNDKKRVQFDFAESSLDKLDDLVARAGVGTRAELIRRALAFYSEVMDAEERKAKVLVRENDGTMIQLVRQF
jgi:hypothetical protein